MAIILNIFDDGYIFQDNFYNKHSEQPTFTNRLNISAHGTRDGGIIINGNRFNAHQLLSFLRQRVVNISQYNYIRLACCFSAHGGENSLAFLLSQIIPFAYIKGYMGGVDTLCQPDIINRELHQYGIHQASIFLTNAMLMGSFVEKNHPEFHSIVFFNGSYKHEKIFNLYGEEIIHE
ncbi:Uncharacterised protein [Yersinia thracica]|uniref:Uncharacterized protein n=1 Tax=Yersinia thracica TaxID=2890319 RepID=A0A0T9QGY1_9GAMM|nr:hypothetical protein [Yersinia thracica]CNI11458.1 Uncharacterised protein [Yersinia thracica]